MMLVNDNCEYDNKKLTIRNIMKASTLINNFFIKHKTGISLNFHYHVINIYYKKSNLQLDVPII